jgi:uncharacterized protein YukE
VLEDSATSRAREKSQKANKARDHSEGYSMSMATLLERLSRTTQEKNQNAQDRFLQLVRKAAQGEEFDIEEAADILEAANRTHEQLEEAVEVQQERIGLAAQLKHKKTLEIQLPKLESVERLAGEHYGRVVSEASDRLNAAKKAKRDVELELLGLTQIEVRLRDSCLDQSLLARERELMATRMALHQQRRPLSEDLDRAKNAVHSHASSVEALRTKIERAKNDQLARQSYKRDLPQFEQALRQSQSVLDQLTQAIEDIDEQLQPIDRELATIREKKLLV